MRVVDINGTISVETKTVLRFTESDMTDIVLARITADHPKAVEQGDIRTLSDVVFGFAGKTELLAAAAGLRMTGGVADLTAFHTLSPEAQTALRFTVESYVRRTAFDRTPVKLDENGNKVTAKAAAKAVKEKVKGDA